MSPLWPPGLRFLLIGLPLAWLAVFFALPFAMARSMVSFETLCFRAFTKAAAKRGLNSGCAPPSLTET